MLSGAESETGSDQGQDQELRLFRSGGGEGENGICMTLMVSKGSATVRRMGGTDAL